MGLRKWLEGLHPCKDSDAGIGTFYRKNEYHAGDIEGWDYRWYGAWVFGAYWGRYLIEVSPKKGIEFHRGFATGCGG